MLWRLVYGMGRKRNSAFCDVCRGFGRVVEMDSVDGKSNMERMDMIRCSVSCKIGMKTFQN